MGHVDHHPPSPREPGRPRRAQRLALELLLPIAFVGAFLVGEGLIGLLGYPVGGERPPFWAGALATIPALVFFALPAVLSSWYAARASRRRQDRRGWVPAGILIALAAGFVVLNTVPTGL